jgi:viroplasmin and RNaseH domain-containing protein
MVHYEVESFYSLSEDWENDFHIDGQPAKFSTYEEAKAFLDEHLKNELEAYNLGEIEDLTGADDYRIVKLTKEAIK